MYTRLSIIYQSRARFISVRVYPDYFLAPFRLGIAILPFWAFGFFFLLGSDFFDLFWYIFIILDCVFVAFN
jgi:hypothetical protein